MDKSREKTFSFKLLSKDGSARAGLLSTPHGAVETPVFMPVGTQATVKSLTPAQLEELNVQILLSNTYHLYLRPGADVIQEFGGLHNFMNWHRPILTDSGGFQVFSLGNLRHVNDEGVVFKSHIDGSTHNFTPESAIMVQEKLGADIIMAFDECPEPHDRKYNEQALARTHQWAERCLKVKSRPDQALFGIVQGGIFSDLRARSAEFLTSLDFPGYSIGGLSVGESKEEMLAVIEVVTAILPEVKPRYLMGVGTPYDLIEGIRRGIDMFDCVLPTRNARNGALFTTHGPLAIKNACYAEDDRPVDERCTCYTCTHFTRAYLRHLFMAKELLAYRLNTIHNLHYYMGLMAGIREAIREDRFTAFRAVFSEQSHE